MRYHVVYDVRSVPEGLDEEEARARAGEHGGACTALLLGSILYPDDGWYSVLFRSVDGRTGEPLDAAQLWKAWVMLSCQLSEDESLSENKRELAFLVWDAVRSVLRERGGDVCEGGPCKGEEGA